MKKGREVGKYGNYFWLFIISIEKVRI